MDFSDTSPPKLWKVRLFVSCAAPAGDAPLMTRRVLDSESVTIIAEDLASQVTF